MHFGLPLFIHSLLTSVPFQGTSGQTSDKNQLNGRNHGHSRARPVSRVSGYSGASAYPDSTAYSGGRPYSDGKAYPSGTAYSDSIPDSEGTAYSSATANSNVYEVSRAMRGYKTSSSSGSSSYSDTRPFSEIYENENIVYSTAEECARTCIDGEAPRYCYYKLVIEYYVTMSAACDYCTPNSTNQLKNVPDCQCIEADGVQRSMMSINRMLPGPSIQLCLNDRMIIDVENKMEAQEVTVHWHGFLQRNYQYYDGVPFITQCPITSGSTFRYQFVAQNPGTHWYHSHSGYQKIDGVYGSIVVREPPNIDPHSRLYDVDDFLHVMLISDWMHESGGERFPGRRTVKPGQLPENVLINGKGRWTNTTSNETTTSSIETFVVKAGLRYRFRLINTYASVCTAQMTMEKHLLTLISQDGEPVEPVHVNTINTHSAERVDYLLTANQTAGCYWIQVRSIGPCSETQPNQIAVLRYKGATCTTPSSPQPTYNSPLTPGIIFEPIDGDCSDTRPDAVCSNQLRSTDEISDNLMKVEPDYQFILPVSFHNYNASAGDLFKPGTYNRFINVGGDFHTDALVGGISFETPSSPPLSEYSPDLNTCNTDNIPENCGTPCRCTHTYSVGLGKVVEVILLDPLNLALSHPFHLHGYSFHVFYKDRFPNPANVTDEDIDAIIKKHQHKLHTSQYVRPPGKDTLGVPPGGYTILRFEANNPGWWFFHCHIMWHMDVGMKAVFHVGEQSDLPPVPKGFPTCGNYKPKVFPEYH